MSRKLIKHIAERLQLLRYAPQGSHYSCHHDSSPDERANFRFMTVFIFLNDVSEGGETVLFGTDLNATYPERRAWKTPDGYENLENKCQPTRSCPQYPGGHMSDPFRGAA